MSTLTTIETPERSAFTYEIAGLGSRSLAYMVDLTLQLLILFIVLAVGTLANMLVDFTWLFVIVLMVLAFSLMWLYMTLFEAFWRGQTPGKRVVGLRVIRDGGATAGFMEIAIRNLLRVIDSVPFPMYLIGVISVFLSSRHQRLGDLVAGTLVVRTSGRSRAQQLSQLVDVHVSSAAVMGQERLGLTTVQAETIASFLARRHQLLPQAHWDLARQLAMPIRQHLAQQPALAARIRPENLYDIDLLNRIIELYRNPALLDAPAAEPSSPEEGGQP